MEQNEIGKNLCNVNLGDKEECNVKIKPNKNNGAGHQEKTSSGTRREEEKEEENIKKTSTENKKEYEERNIAEEKNNENKVVDNQESNNKMVTGLEIVENEDRCKNCGNNDKNENEEIKFEGGKDGKEELKNETENGIKNERERNNNYNIKDEIKSKENSNINEIEDNLEFKEEKPKLITYEEQESTIILTEVEGKDIVFENGYKERNYTQQEINKIKCIDGHLSKLSKDEKIKFLRKVAQEPHGFVGGKVRAHAWAILLDLDDGNKISVPNGFLVHALKGPWIVQVLKDTNRSLYEWVGDDEREYARRHLASVITKVLELGWISAERKDFEKQRPKDLPKVEKVEENVPGLKELYYFQGFHDIASTVMLTTNSEDMSVSILYTLARKTLAPLFESTLYPTLDIINGIFKVIEKVDPELFDFIKRSSVTPDFALSWVLTWFSHNVRDLAALQRIFDYLIASQDTREVVLLSVAYIRSCRAQLLNLKCDRDYICMFFKSKSPAIVLSAKESNLEIVNSKSLKVGGCVEVGRLISDAVKLKKKLSFKLDYVLLSYIIVGVFAVGVGLFLYYRE